MDVYRCIKKQCNKVILKERWTEEKDSSKEITGTSQKGPDGADCWLRHREGPEAKDTSSLCKLLKAVTRPPSSETPKEYNLQTP